MTNNQQSIIIHCCQIIVFILIASTSALAEAPATMLPSGACDADSCATIENLPQADFRTNFLPTIARFLVLASAIVAFLVFIVAGAMLVFSWGNDEQIKKARGIAVWGSVGLVLIAFAYALVRVILELGIDQWAMD